MSEAKLLEAGLSDVKILAAADAARWDAFVRSHPEGTFYHLTGWRDVIGGHLGHDTYYLYVERAGEIDGVLPLGRVRSRLFGDALISLPFLVYGGPIANSDEALTLLVDAATELAESLGVDYLELRNRRKITDWPTKDTHVTFRKPMEADADSNLKAIPRKQRAVVRKAIKAGLAAELDADSGRLHAILSECKRNLGTPFFSRHYLQYVKDTFGDDCEIQLITHKDELLAGVMSFIFRDEILPYYGGGGADARPYGANDFMYWKVMERAADAGLKIFDFGRSQKGTGPYKFKKYWAFEPEPLSYEFYLVRASELPKVDPNNAKYRLMVNAWTKLPLPIAKTVGPPLARLLG